jgi:hypothetical protein
MTIFMIWLIGELFEISLDCTWLRIEPDAGR